MHKSLLLLFFCSLLSLAAVDQETMTRPKETTEVWKAQAKDLSEVSDIPRFTGAYVWRGRADRDYLAFHQWEFRLEAGKRPVTGVKLRVLVLGADLKPTLRGTGAWQSIGDLAAEAEKTLSYKMNTNQPVAYRVELEYAGGTESYLAADPTQVPQVEGPAEAGPRLLMLQTSFDNDRKKQLVVTFMLRNDGAVAAEQVELTLKFYDEKGTVVHSVPYVPEGGTVPAGYAKEQQVVLKQSPKFKTIGIEARLGNAAAGGGVILDPGVFTDAKTLELGELTLAHGKLRAVLRNGTAQPIGCVRVSVQLLDAKDKVVKIVQVDLTDVAADERRPLMAETGELAGVVSWGVGFEMAGDGGDGGDAVAAPQTLETEAGGVTLKVLKVTTTDAGVKLQVKVTNGTGKDIAGLLCELTLSDGDHKKPAKVACGDLTAGADFEGSVVALGLKRLSGLSMGWKGGVTQ